MMFIFVLCIGFLILAFVNEIKWLCGVSGFIMGFIGVQIGIILDELSD